MGTSSARPDDLDGFVAGSRAADDELRAQGARLLSAYISFEAGVRWGHFDASSLINAFGRYTDLNEADAQWVEQIAAAFRRAGGDGGPTRLPDAAIEASLRAAGQNGGRQSVTFDDPVALGFPATTGYADDPVNTASGNFLIAEAELPVGGLAAGLILRRTYNSRSDQPGAFGPGWSSWADARLHTREDGAEYRGPDGQRALFPRQGTGYGRVIGVNAVVSATAAGLTMRWTDGRVREFDAAGRPVTIDGRITLGYADGRLTQLADSGGRSVDLLWTGDRITTAVASDGRRVGYTYAGGVLVTAGDRRYAVDDHARIVTVTDADGVVEAANTYDAAGRVVEQVSRFGRRTLFAYLPGGVTVTMGEEPDSPADTYVHDAHGRLIALVDAHGRRLSRTYDEWGNPVTVTDRNGAVSTTVWDERSRPVRRVEPGGAAFDYVYDEDDRVLSVAASTGGTVRYRYEGSGRTPSEVVDAEGGVTRLAVSDGLVRQVTDPDGVVLTFGFDADGALESTTDALGRTARIERDPAGRVVATVTPLGRRTTFEYDGDGRVVERRDMAGGIWRYEYSAAGRVTAVIDPTGARRETRYGPHGEVEASVDPLGQTSTRRYDEMGNLARLVAADGAKWDFTHDALSRLTATTDPAGATWMREYDATGNLIGSVDPAGTHHSASVDTNGRVTGISDGRTGSSFEFDELGRAVAHVRPDGTAARAGYDRCGRRTSIVDPGGGVTRIEYSAAGRIRRTISPGGRATSYEYNAAGRLAARIDAGGARVEFGYDADGALLSRTLPAEVTETFGYDQGGRLVTHEMPGRGVTRYAYDPAGRVVEVTDATGGVRRFGYDPAGRLIEAVDPLGGRTRYGYHVRGWLTSITDPLGATTTRAYDEAGRPVSETDPLGRVTTFEYNAAGRLVSRVDGAGRRIRWTYDVSGRVLSMAGGDDPAVTFERDALGRPVEINEPGSYRHRLRWDAGGRLVERQRDDLTLGFRYGPDGERAGLRFPDGTEATYAYDEGGRLSGLRHPAVGQVIIRRDRAGRVIAADTARAGAAWEYTGADLTGYRFGDRSTRLTRDAAGRITAAGDLTYRYDAAGQLIQAGSQTFEYDAAGRLIRDGDVVCRYDAAGQLISRGDTTYEYDGSGRRSYRWDSFGRPAGNVSVDALGELAEVDGQAVLWAGGEPAWLGDRPVISPWTEASQPDWQGTFGEGRDVWGAPARAEPGLGFRGELEFDGLTWLRNRVYDPSTRAFLSPDPLPPVPGTAWSGNPYHYAGNDPIGHADPSGLRPVTDAELRAYRDEMGRNGFEKAADWTGENWEYLAAGAMIVGGVALMFTGVGGPAGIALMAASGGLIAGGASAGIQKFATGEVDWAQVGRDGLVGAATGGVGAGTTAALSSTARLASTNPFIREMALNGAEALASGGVERGLTGGDIFNPRALATDLLTGGAAPAPGGRVGAGDDLVTVHRFHTASDPQTLLPKLTLDSPEYQAYELRKFEGPDGPAELAEAVERHAGGRTRHSQFVSVTTDPDAAARTTDPQLRTIINGTPGMEGFKQATDLSTFQVPRSSLYRPTNPLSVSEDELLFRGNNLADYRTDTMSNPYPKPPHDEES